MRSQTSIGTLPKLKRCQEHYQLKENGRRSAENGSLTCIILGITGRYRAIKNARNVKRKRRQTMGVEVLVYGALICFAVYVIGYLIFFKSQEVDDDDIA